MERKRNRERGLLSLEACIALTIFIFLMLFMYSFFVVFEARNEMAHVLLSTADSLALDAYQNATLGDSGTIGQVIYVLYGTNANENSDFTDYRSWHKSTTVQDGSGNEVIAGEFEEVVRMRFVAYLTGGDSTKAEQILKRYHVKGGVDGLDFSSSRVKDGKLYLVIKYTLEYEFHVFNGGKAEFEQSVCSKLWK